MSSSSTPASASLHTSWDQSSSKVGTSRWSNFKSLEDVQSCKDCSNDLLDWQYSADSDDESSVSSVDTVDNDYKTVIREPLNGRWSPFSAGKISQPASCPGSGASTRHSSFSIAGAGSINSYGSSGSLSSLNKAELDKSKAKVTPSPSRRNSLEFKADNICGIAHPTRDVSAYDGGHLQRQIEHDLRQQSNQLVILSKDAAVPHIQIHVQDQTATELIANSTAVLRTTRTGQAVLRRSYGVQGVPTPAGARVRASHAVLHERRRSLPGDTAQDVAYGAATRNLQRSGAASDSMIDSIEAHLDALCSSSKPGFAKPTMGHVVSSVAHPR